MLSKTSGYDATSTCYLLKYGLPLSDLWKILQNSSKGLNEQIKNILKPVHNADIIEISNFSRSFVVLLCSRSKMRKQILLSKKWNKTVC